jgi:hypothetical protein
MEKALDGDGWRGRPRPMIRDKDCSPNLIENYTEGYAVGRWCLFFDKDYLLGLHDEGEGSSPLLSSSIS